MYFVLRPHGATGEKRGQPLCEPEASVTLPAEPVSRPHRKEKITKPPQMTPFSAPSFKQQRVLMSCPKCSELLPSSPRHRLLGGSDSPHICPIALANLKGKPNEMFGEVNCRGHSTSKRSGGLRQRGSGRTVCHTSALQL